MRHRGEIGVGYFILPAAVVMGLLLIVPIIALIGASFWDVSLARPAESSFVGFANYLRALRDSRFLRSLQVTIVYATIVVLSTVILGLIAAITLNQRGKSGRPLVRGGYSIRSILLVPGIMAPAATGVLFGVFLFDYDFGVLNHYLRVIGIGRIPWLLHPTLALLCVAFVQTWIRFPYTMLIFDGALRSMPHSYYEAAVLDGASIPRQIRSITVPLLKPQIVFAFVFQVFFAFNQFDIAFMLTGGGPGDSTRIMTLYIMEEVLRRLNYGLGMAQAVILVLIVTVFVLIGLKLLGKTGDIR